MNCPLCGMTNNCGRLAGLPPEACWCSRQSFPAQIFERLPQDQLNKSCICQACLEKFKET
ncbi:cysteine-rich CWC family protein [Cohnella sp.]|uniref:cysteine-rich CWC family protein n=1 Tax=Cohnella sp. TaxID=1883426 RepID=UPI003569BA45